MHQDLSVIQGVYGAFNLSNLLFPIIALPSYHIEPLLTIPYLMRLLSLTICLAPALLSFILVSTSPSLSSPSMNESIRSFFFFFLDTPVSSAFWNFLRSFANSRWKNLSSRISWIVRSNSSLSTSSRKPSSMGSSLRLRVSSCCFRDLYRHRHKITEPHICMHGKIHIQEARLSDSNGLGHACSKLAAMFVEASHFRQFQNLPPHQQEDLRGQKSNNNIYRCLKLSRTPARLQPTIIYSFPRVSITASINME